MDTGNESDFAVFETALKYTHHTNFTIGGSAVDVSYYFINSNYLKDLALVESPDVKIPLQDKNEIGFTFTLPKYSWLPENTQLGLGVQSSGESELYRLVVGAPFF